MKMNTGWTFFFALLLALLVGGLCDNLFGLEGWTPWAIGLVVFVVLVVAFSVMRMLNHKKEKEKTEE